MIETLKKGTLRLKLNLETEPNFVCSQQWCPLKKGGGLNLTATCVFVLLEHSEIPRFFPQIQLIRQLNY